LFYNCETSAEVCHAIAWACCGGQLLAQDATILIAAYAGNTSATGHFQSSGLISLQTGSLRALAVSTPNRLPALPGIPTFAELGYPKLTGSQWLGLSAPKGLPAPIGQRLSAPIPEIPAKPDFAASLEELQTLPRKNAVMGDEFVQLIRSQIETWRGVAKLANVKVIT
jgi:tripartite-type tricarboxylate transporter receptor subunit TctC